jgi:hypothetical protein
LQGLWFGTDFRSRPNAFNGMDMVAERSYIAMNRNGFAYRALPSGGQVEPLNAASLCTSNVSACGTYRVESTRIVFDWYTDLGLVQTDSATSERSQAGAAAFSLHRTEMSRVTPVPATRLDGRFTSTDGTASGPNGSIAPSRSITFRMDGTYESSERIGYLARPGGSVGNDASVVGSNISGIVQGTYQIQGYMLTMRPNNEAVRYSTIIFFDDKRPPTAVLIDDFYYRR